MVCEYVNIHGQCVNVVELRLLCCILLEYLLLAIFSFRYFIHVMYCLFVCLPSDSILTKKNCKILECDPLWNDKWD